MVRSISWQLGLPESWPKAYVHRDEAASEGGRTSNNALQRTHSRVTARAMKRTGRATLRAAERER